MSRRDEIIQAGIRLSQRQTGTVKLSVRTVAQEAGVGASTLRHYFPTQAELHEAIARASLDVAINDFSIADTSIDPVERLVECCNQFLLTEEHRELQLEMWFSMHFTTLGRDADNEAAKRLLAHGHRLTYASLRKWLGILAEEGHLDLAEVDPAATAIFTIADGTSLHALVSPETMTVEAIRAQMRWLITKILHRG